VVSPAAGCQSLATRDRCRTAVAATIFLWAVFTAIHALDLDSPLGSIVFFVLGLAGIGTLVVLGFGREDCYLRLALLSWSGFIALTAFLPLLVPILLSGEWVGWGWLRVLVYAPLSGIAQELFFRATLLPVFLMVFNGRPLFGVFLHSIVFALWHTPLAAMTAPLGGAMAVKIVTFAGGMACGWQVQRDKTLVWAMPEHCLFLMAMELFEW
jgi:membrane protease YdiL (CAAX protease family)